MTEKKMDEAEDRLLITPREEFLVTASSKIQPRGGCNVSLIYRLTNTVSFVCNARLNTNGSSKGV